MARRLGKGYQPNDIRTATFKLSHEKWERFQAVCKGEGRSASDVLLEFVESILNGDNLPTKDDGSALAIANLEKEIAAVNARLDKLDSKDDRLPTQVKSEPLQGIVEGQESLSEKIQEPLVSPEPVETETLEGMMAKYPDGISQSELGHRYKVSQGAVGNQLRKAREANNPDRFINWSRGHEAKLGNDFAWQFKEDSPNLFPVP